MRVVVADRAGACFGVERALELAHRMAREATGPVRTLGPLIHNPVVVDELEAMGVGAVDAPEQVEAGYTLLMRAHGVTPEVERRARDAGAVVVDATCPFVKKVHVAAERLAADGYQVLVAGEKGHPEVEGTVGHAPGALVVGSAEDVEGLELARRVGVVAQTTLAHAVLRDVVGALVGRCEELRVVDTICAATNERQEAAAQLARNVDVMVVLGGRNSANTRHLADICREGCSRTHHVERADEIDAAWFVDAEVVGLTAGASTPAAQIEDARAHIDRLASPTEAMMP